LTDSSIVKQLYQRKMFRIAVGYLAVAWLLWQVVDTTCPTFECSLAFQRTIFWLLLGGLPVTLAVAWVNWKTAIIVGVAFIAGAGVAVMMTAGSQPAPAEPIVEETDQQRLPNSVAVLPFENLSPDPDNAYFAAGIHEEVLNALVKLQNLSVISRTSVIRYATSELSIPEIATQLNVETVMEGSVRYAGDRVRITAQLIDARTDEHLWSDTYERDFADVFGIQADIAMNIANAMQVEFSIAEQQGIEAVATQSPAAYAHYLKAIDMWWATGTDFSWLPEMDQAIALDPDFAAALARKAYIIAVILSTAGTGLDDVAHLKIEAQAAAERAVALDPNLGTAHAALAALYQLSWQGGAAERAFQLAYELTPDTDVLLAYGRFKRYRGEFDEAVRLGQRAVELDPQSGFTLGQLGVTYRFARRFDEAVAALQRSMELPPGPALGVILNIAQAEAGRGNFSEAGRQLDLGQEFPQNASVFRLSQLALASSLAGRTDDAARYFSDFQKRAEVSTASDTQWARAYIAVGDYDAALLSIESAVNDRSSADLASLAELAANSWGDPMLDEPEFRELLDALWVD
jgi:TolB-like protein/Tfp pilus assembly protein PilF